MAKRGVTWLSDSRESIYLAWKMQQENLVDIHYYIHDPNYRDNFKGILPITLPSSLNDALRRSEAAIVDITLPMSTDVNQPSYARDTGLLRQFGINPKVPGVFGALADKLSKTHWVIGSGSWCEHIELDRIAGIKLAQKLGFSIPEYHEFTSLKAGVKFLEANSDDKWVFKPLGNKDLDLTYPDTFKGELLDLMQVNLPDRFKKDNVKFILQKFIDGSEVSSELWWNGQEFLNPNRTIEDKKLGSGNTGPATGSQSNLVWMCDDMDGVVFKEMQGLVPYLKKSGYLGPIDANCIISEDGKPWFLEWTPRMGWSALYCFLSFLPEGQLTNFFLNGFKAIFKDGYVASQLISLFPYPILDKKQLDVWTKGNLVNHPLNMEGMYWQDIYQDDQKNLRVCGSDGIVGVLTARGDTAEEAIDNLHDRIEGKKGHKKLEISGNLQHRTRHDHMTRTMERVKKLNKIIGE